jgi:hypothetical protein
MENGLEESIRFKRQFKRALIVFAVIEFIVTALVVFRVASK